MKKLFFFDGITRALISSRLAQVIPGLCEEQAADFPNCTDVVPPEIPEGFTAVFGEGEGATWTVVEDNRGYVYRKDGRGTEHVKDLGPLPPHLVKTAEAPEPLSRWSDAAGAWEPDPDQLREQQLRQVEVIYRRRLAAGFAFREKAVQADESSQGKINGAVTMAMLAQQGAQPFSITWTCADNSTLTLDAAGMCELGAACGEFVLAAFYRRRALKDALQDADTAEAVQAIDLESNWP